MQSECIGNQINLNADVRAVNDYLTQVHTGEIVQAYMYLSTFICVPIQYQNIIGLNFKIRNFFYGEFHL